MRRAGWRRPPRRRCAGCRRGPRRTHAVAGRRGWCRLQACKAAQGFLAVSSPPPACRSRRTSSCSWRPARSCRRPCRHCRSCEVFGAARGPRPRPRPFHSVREVVSRAILCLRSDAGGRASLVPKSACRVGRVDYRTGLPTAAVVMGTIDSRAARSRSRSRSGSRSRSRSRSRSACRARKAASSSTSRASIAADHRRSAVLPRNVRRDTMPHGVVPSRVGGVRSVPVAVSRGGLLAVAAGTASTRTWLRGTRPIGCGAQCSRECQCVDWSPRTCAPSCVLVVRVDAAVDGA
jgi:hypothetical protein